VCLTRVEQNRGLVNKWMLRGCVASNHVGSPGFWVGVVGCIIEIPVRDVDSVESKSTVQQTRHGRESERKRPGTDPRTKS
jgi:hypothetical protein